MISWDATSSSTKRVHLVRAEVEAGPAVVEVVADSAEVEAEAGPAVVEAGAEVEAAGTAVIVVETGVETAAGVVAVAGKFFPEFPKWE
jgi:hypothetical protein